MFLPYSAVGRNDGVVYPNPDGTFIKEMYVLCIIV